jgi:hypothetical protein
VRPHHSTVKEFPCSNSEAKRVLAALEEVVP